jgi:hypothetical protein
MFRRNRVAPEYEMNPKDKPFAKSIRKMMDNIFCETDNPVKNMTKAIVQRVRSQDTQIRTLMRKLADYKPSSEGRELYWFISDIINIFVRCNSGFNLIRWGIENNFDKMDKLIEDYFWLHAQLHSADGTRTLLHLAVSAGNLQVVNVLLKYNVSVNILDDKGYTPLHDAVLLRNKAPQEEYADSQSSTPRSTVSAIVKALLAAGASPYAGNAGSAFTDAISEQDLDSIKLFMKSSIKPNYFNLKTIFNEIEKQYKNDAAFCHKLLKVLYTDGMITDNAKLILYAKTNRSSYANIIAFLESKKGSLNSRSQQVKIYNDNLKESSGEPRAKTLKQRNDFIREQTDYFVQIPDNMKIINDIDLLNTNECAICLDERDDMKATTLDDFVITKCGHTYHKACLEKWFEDKTLSRRVCPKCRKKVENIDDLIHFGGKKKSVKPRKPKQRKR